MSDPEPSLKLRELKLDDLRRENQRLRDARASLTSQLGPLPISAAVVAGLVSGFGGDGTVLRHHWLAVSALCAFGAMVLVSTLSSAFAPYRKLRERAEDRAEKAGGTDPAARRTESHEVAAWYDSMIRIEQEVRDGAGAEGSLPRWRAKSLQDAYDKEWKGAFATKLLFVAAIVLLILARGIG